MFRKNICVILFLCFFLSACKENSHSTLITTEEVTLSPHNKKSQTTYSNIDVAYEIITENYNFQVYSSEDIIDVNYPQIKGLSGDASKEKAINDIIKNHFWEINSRFVDNPMTNDNNGNVLEFDIIYHITMQTDELLSIVYESYSTFHNTSDGRDGNSRRNCSDAYGITIDLVNATRLDLLHFTPLDISKEDPVIDLHYRIEQSTELLAFGSKGEVYKDSENLGYRSMPFLAVDDNYNFFITPDSTYYILKFGAADGYYEFVRILDEAGPYELPKG